LKFVFQAAAKTEFIEAIAWYESQRPGLGREFVLETGRALKLAWQNPELFRKVRGKARKIRLRRFSYYRHLLCLARGRVSVCFRYFMDHATQTNCRNGFELVVDTHGLAITP